MDNEQKVNKINAILSQLEYVYESRGEQFPRGDTFLSLCFKTDDQINKICILMGI